MISTHYRISSPHILIGAALLCWIALCTPSVRAADADVEKQLADKGVKFTSVKGVITSASVADCSAWTDADFMNLAQLTHLKSVDFAAGLTDKGAALLAGLPELDTIQTNKAQITDTGVKAFAGYKSLRVLKFFHPNKSFTGAGLADLASLPTLQSLTVAGSDSFGDAGMAAVGKLQQLREFRTWHAGQTPSGMAKLRELTNLRSLNLGQALRYTAPAAVSDETIAILLELKSLESIQLSEARLKLSALLELKHLPNLKTLTLDGIDLPEADVETLKREMPKVQVKWTKPTESYARRIKALYG